MRMAFIQLDLLPALELVVTVADGEWGPHSRAEFKALRAGCAGIAAWLRHGRRRHTELRKRDIRVSRDRC